MDQNPLVSKDEVKFAMFRSALFGAASRSFSTTLKEIIVLSSFYHVYTSITCTTCFMFLLYILNYQLLIKIGLFVNKLKLFLLNKSDS